MSGFIAGSGRVNIDIIYGGLNRLPALGEELYSDSFDLKLGGGTPGTLINLKRLNIPALLATYLGEDMFSSFAKGELINSGVKAVNLYKGKDCPAVITSAMLTPGERTFVSYAATIIEKGEIYEVLKGARFALMERGFAKDYYRLKNEGVRLVLDTGWDEKMNLDTYREYLELADYYLPNRKEALLITGAKDIEEAASVLSGFFPEVIIKLDSEGTYFYKEGKGKIIKSIKEFIHRDSTGAGDAFLAGFLYGLYHNYSAEEAILFGNLTGGKCVTERGCLTAYLNEEELLFLYKKYLSFI